MTRRVPLPTESEVRSAHETMCAQEAQHDVTVVKLAQQLGLTNATFWRYFPGIAQEIADARRATPRAAAQVPTAASEDRAASLRVDIARLREQLELAVVHIQRLTIENEELRAQLEAASAVIHLPRRD